MSRDSGTLLHAAAATGAGEAVDVAAFRNFLFGLTAAGVTDGATLQIEARLVPEGEWFVIHEQEITEDGNVLIQAMNVRLYEVRGNIPSRTDGTYTLVYSAVK